MSSITELHRRSGAVLPALIALVILAWAPAAAAGSNDAVKPAELRKGLQKVDKRLQRAEEALQDGKSGRVSTLLRLADEDLALFLEGSGLEPLVEMMARARRAAAQPQLPGAQTTLLAIRARMSSISDYIVRRDAEVAYRAARRAAEQADLDAYVEALHQLDAAILAPLLIARIETARQAIAGGRAAMVGRNMQAGKSETRTARAAIDGLWLAAALSQAVFRLQFAVEFVADGYAMAAREQLRQGGRALRQAIEVAPPDRRAELQRAEEDVLGVLDRLAKPLPEDAGTLRNTLAMVKALRSGQQ